jgi:hypothetical protein
MPLKNSCSVIINLLLLLLLLLQYHLKSTAGAFKFNLETLQTPTLEHIISKLGHGLH